MLFLSATTKLNYFGTVICCYAVEHKVLNDKENNFSIYANSDFKMNRMIPSTHIQLCLSL